MDQPYLRKSLQDLRGGIRALEGKRILAHPTTNLLSQNDFLHCSSNKDFIKHRALRDCRGTIFLAGSGWSGRYVQARYPSFFDLKLVPKDPCVNQEIVCRFIAFLRACGGFSKQFSAIGA